MGRNNADFHGYTFSYEGPAGPYHDHSVNAQHPESGELIGHLRWDSEHGEISDVEVDTEHQRKGVASGLLNYARRVSQEQGFPEPVHSNLRTHAGDAWARSVGGENARGYNVEWING